MEISGGGSSRVPVSVRIAGIASAAVFVLYMALGMQISGLVGQVAFLSKDLQSAQSTATVIGLIIGIAGLYESSLAYKGRTGALVALALFHLLAGGVLASLRSKSPEAEQVAGAAFGGALAMVGAIEAFAFVTSGVCVVALVVKLRAPAPPQQPQWPQQMSAPVPAPIRVLAPAVAARTPEEIIARRKRERVWWIAGAVVGAAVIAIGAIAANVGKGKSAAPAFVLVDDSGYAMSDGCSGGAEQCSGPWHAVTYYRGGDMIFAGPCWGVCGVGEHARPLDLRDVDLSSVSCVPGTYYRQGMSSCKVTFQRRRPEGSVAPPPPPAPFVDEDEKAPEPTP